MQNQDIELITRLVMEAIQEQAPSEQGFAVPVGVSARHVHLSQADLETLFGEGYQLTKKKELMGGQFASNEQVTLVGLKLRAIENVRILGRSFQCVRTNLEVCTVTIFNNSNIDEVHLRRTDEACNEQVDRVIVQSLRSIYLLNNTILHNNDSGTQSHSLGLVMCNVDDGCFQSLM